MNCKTSVNRRECVKYELLLPILTKQHHKLYFIAWLLISEKILIQTIRWEYKKQLYVDHPNIFELLLKETPNSQ